MKIRNKTEKAIVVTSLPPGVTTRFLGGETKDLDGGFAYLASDPSFEVLDEEPAADKPDKGKGRGKPKEPEEGSKE